jgi:hypothetical protein
MLSERSPMPPHAIKGLHFCQLPVNVADIPMISQSLSGG